MIKHNNLNDDQYNSSKEIMSTGKKQKKEREQNYLYKNFLLNAIKEKEKFKQKPQTSKTMSTNNGHPENAYKTNSDWKKSKLLKNLITQNTINEKSPNNNKLTITITNPNTIKKHRIKQYKQFDLYNKDKILSFNNNSGNLSPYRAISDDYKNKETGIEDNTDDKYEENRGSKNYAFSTGKYEKKMKLNNWKNDPFNPYLTNWANSFLKIGYNVGFHYSELQKGVPLLRIQKLKKKVILPPLYKVKYNKFTENKYDNNEDDISNLVCSKVAHKIFSPINTYYQFHTNRPDNAFYTHYNFSCKDKEKNEESEQKSLRKTESQKLYKEIDGINSKNENSNNNNDD